MIPGRVVSPGTAGRGREDLVLPLGLRLPSSLLPGSSSRQEQLLEKVLGAAWAACPFLTVTYLEDPAGGGKGHGCVWADLRSSGSGPKCPGCLLLLLPNTVRSLGSPAGAGKPGAPSPHPPPGPPDMEVGGSSPHQCLVHGRGWVRAPAWYRG